MLKLMGQTILLSKRAKPVLKIMACELTTIRVMSSFETCMFNYNVSSRTILHLC